MHDDRCINRTMSNTEPVLEYTGKQRENWRDHVNRMDRRRMPK